MGVMEFKLNRHINAPIDVVFAKATDLRKADQVISAITKLEVLTDGPIRVGTRFRETRVMFKREATEEMEVTRLDAPHGYSLGCENHGCRYNTEFNLTEKDGGTELEMIFQAEPLTLTAKVMGFLMRPMLKRCLIETGRDLDDLKQAVEAELAPA